MIFEAIVLGIPIVCTEAGGLRALPPGGHMLRPAGRPDALRAAVVEVAADDERRFDMAVMAQRRVFAAGLTTQGYADCFRRLSGSFLGSVRPVGFRAACETPFPGGRRPGQREGLRSSWACLRRAALERAVRARRDSGAQ